MADEKPLNIGDLAAAVVAQDDDLRDDLAKLMKTIIAHMQYTMMYGEATAKTALAKSITPQLLRGLHQAAGNEQDREMKAAYERMMNELAGGSRETEPSRDD